MNNRYRAKLGAALLFCLAIGGIIGYLAAIKQSRAEQMDMFYSSSAADVRITTTALRLLRSGRSDKVTRYLEAILDANPHVANERRTDVIYASAEEARKYYRDFPQAQPSPYATDGLALGVQVVKDAP